MVSVLLVEPTGTFVVDGKSYEEGETYKLYEAFGAYALHGASGEKLLLKNRELGIFRFYGNSDGTKMNFYGGFKVVGEKVFRTNTELDVYLEE